MKFDFVRMVVIPLVLLILFAIAGQFVGSFVFAELAHLPDWQWNSFWQYKNSDWANYKGVHWRLNDRDAEFGGKFESSGLERPGLSVVKPHGLLRVDQNLFAAVQKGPHALEKFAHGCVVGA